MGARTPPRRDNVIVVGMGQVGTRVSTQLRSLGIPVVGVERNRDAPLLGTARALGIPVVIANGSDRRTLEKVHIRRCRALAVVASDDLDNVAVAVAAAAVSPHVRVVFRAGETERVTETRSLLPLGIARDVTQLASAFVVAVARGHRCTGVAVGPGGRTCSQRTRRRGGYPPQTGLLVLTGAPNVLLARSRCPACGESASPAAWHPRAHSGPTSRRAGRLSPSTLSTSGVPEPAEWQQFARSS